VEFSDFFERTTSKAPYEYQRYLAEQSWPEVLIAPTGLGKTAAVVLGWLWRRHVAPELTPRRLIYCLPMRTLVEQTKRNVCAWLASLPTAGFDENLPRPDDVHVLMGGTDRADEPRWYELPERSAILIGTQDMLISRALMRGYGAPRTRWPMEFALVHNDAHWVFDEVQLMGAALPTSCQLQAFRASLDLAHDSGSLWISATLDPYWLHTVDFGGPRKVLRVPDDFREDASSERVRKLIESPKPLSRAAFRPESERKIDVDSYISHLASKIRALRAPGGRSLVIVNTVDRAQKLYSALRKLGIPGTDLVLVHSRFRPADRREHMAKLLDLDNCVAVATQAIEAGVDVSSKILITELAPWSSLVQRFGRANRYGEYNDSGGASLYWIDLPPALAAPYEAQELDDARRRLAGIQDAAPAKLGRPGDLLAIPKVIRQKDLFDLFDTSPDLTGSDVDISPYVRDAIDTDVHVFWRDLELVGTEPPRASRDELCPVSMGRARDWVDALRKRKPPLQVYVTDPQWRRGETARPRVPPGWRALDGVPWPGLTLLVDVAAAGYESRLGFTGEGGEPVPEIKTHAPEGFNETDTSEGDEGSEGYMAPVTLDRHLDDVADEAARITSILKPWDKEVEQAIERAARWHDIGKAHEVFQDTMRRGLLEPSSYDGTLLAKTQKRNVRHKRPYFRHELASALAFLTSEIWAREADLAAYLIGAHHGKVRMSLRALPAEPAPPGPGHPPDGRRFARGIWDGDELPGNGEIWRGGKLMLSVMDIGEDPVTGASWTERVQALLSRYGPFRLAWAEALVMIADRRASAREQDEKKCSNSKPIA
jgi:CRISPR-associated endonuclease/helicase Cas3